MSKTNAKFAKFSFLSRMRLLFAWCNFSMLKTIKISGQRMRNSVYKLRINFPHTFKFSDFSILQLILIFTRKNFDTFLVYATTP